MLSRENLFPRVSRAVPCFLILLPAALSFLYVNVFGVNVIYRDQWSLVPLFGSLATGNLGFADLFAPHNEHRIFLPGY